MSALARLMIAGAAAALFSAQAIAMEPSVRATPVADVAAAQQLPAQAADAPAFCIAADKCAVALTADYLVRYDQHMDEVLGR